MFYPANPSELLNYEGTELLLIGGRTNITEELGIRIKSERETLKIADIFTDLKLWKKEHTIVPLIGGC